MKMVRDQNARDAYVRDEGINIGVEQERNRLANLIARMNAEATKISHPFAGSGIRTGNVKKI